MIIKNIVTGKEYELTKTQYETLKENNRHTRFRIMCDEDIVIGKTDMPSKLQDFLAEDIKKSPVVDGVVKSKRPRKKIK